MAKKDETAETPELPPARPLPHEASPGGTEGAEPGWAGGASNVGEVMHAPSAGAPYSTSDSEGAPRVDVVARVTCEHCGQAFQNQELLNVHMRTAHRPAR